MAYDPNVFRRANARLGLILPGLLALLGVLCYCKVPGYSILWLIPLCLPALLVLALYLTCRRMKKQFANTELLPDGSSSDAEDDGQN